MGSSDFYRHPLVQVAGIILAAVASWAGRLEEEIQELRAELGLNNYQKAFMVQCLMRITPICGGRSLS
jgi:hypothetical protein